MPGKFMRLAEYGKPRVPEKRVVVQSKLILRDYLSWEVNRQRETSLNPLVTVSQIAPSTPAPGQNGLVSPVAGGDGAATAGGNTAPVAPEERDDLIGNLLKLDTKVCSDVSQKVIAMGRELELRYPHIFKGMASNLRLDLSSSNQLIAAFQTVSHELFRFGVTWIRIVALFVITKSLFLECAIEGNDQHSIQLVETFQLVVRKRLAEWIARKGGWIGLAYYVEKNQESSFLVWFYSAVGLLIGVTVTWLIPWTWRTYTVHALR